MTQPAKSHEPSMEEILASIRRIIADDDAKPEAMSAEPSQPAAAANGAAKPATPTRPSAPPVRAAEPPRPAPAAAANNQDDIDSLLAGLDADTSAAEIRADAADVLDLTEQMAVVEAEANEPLGFKNIDAHDDIEFAETPATPSPAPERPRTPPPSFVAKTEPVPPQQPLMSPSTMTAVNSAFNSLAQTVLSNNARTLEDLVKEMLRPMLKGWLDDNLPGLVEKIVRAEIERVSRGR